MGASRGREPSLARSTNRTQEGIGISASLQRKLSLCSLAAGAAAVEVLASANPAAAEVVFTPAHQVIEQNQMFAIDLNHDGTTDFTIQNVVTNRDGHRDGKLQVAAGGSGGVVITSFQNAKALIHGQKIGAPDLFRAGRAVMAYQFYLLDGGTYTYGNWLGASNEYLGFRFKIAGEVHYGWARVSTQWNGHFQFVAEVTGYAYQTVANTLIFAGAARDEEDQSIEDQSIDDVSGEAQQDTVPTLGVLACGAQGLSIWRGAATREEIYEKR
jgi:hypothetical protein